MVFKDNYFLCPEFEMLIKAILKYFLMTFVIETGCFKL